MTIALCLKRQPRSDSHRVQRDISRKEAGERGGKFARWTHSRHYSEAAGQLPLTSVHNAGRGSDTLAERDLPARINLPR